VWVAGWVRVGANHKFLTQTLRRHITCLGLKPVGVMYIEAGSLHGGGDTSPLLSLELIHANTL